MLKEGVDPKHLPAVLILAAGGTQTEAGKAVGLSRHAIMRWADTPAWRAAVRSIRDATVSEASGLLADAARDAVARLRLVCEDGQKEQNQLKAADTILTQALRYRSQLDIEDRLAKVEQELASGRATSHVKPDAEPIAEN